jgi:hypothetical protein
MLVSTADKSRQPIFPEFSSSSQWPWTLLIVVSEARRILSYFELPEKAHPPKAIWHSPTKCADFIRTAMDLKNPSDQQFLEFNDSEVET